MFTITKDHIADVANGDKSREGMAFEKTPLYGMERAMGVNDWLPAAQSTVEFRLYDDDGELHYEGVLDDDTECANQSAALRFGETDTGCTLIKVRREGEWVIEIG